MAHTTLPGDLPVPKDDGACSHLTGSAVPSTHLPSTGGTSVDLATMAGMTIVFIYPRTGAPDEVVPDDWNAIPGARGCTPQACSFRDKANDLLAGGVSHVFGMSTQDTAYQKEVRERLHLPYQLLSDEQLQFQQALNIPVFEWKGSKVMKRVTLALVDGKIVKTWYPVFPPNESANEVVRWLENDWPGRDALATDTENAMMRNLQHR